MSILKGYLFDFLHSNGMLSVLIRSASIKMSTHDILFHDKIRKFLNLYFLKLSEEFLNHSKTGSN